MQNLFVIQRIVYHLIFSYSQLHFNGFHLQTISSILNISQDERGSQTVTCGPHTGPPVYRTTERLAMPTSEYVTIDDLIAAYKLFWFRLRIQEI